MATPRVMAAVTGSLYCAGGSVVLAAGLDGLPVTPAVAGLLAIGALSVLTGLACLRWGRLLGRGVYHLLVAAGTVLIAAASLLAEHPATATALAGLMVFVALDSFFYFAGLGAVLQLLGAMAGGTAVLLVRPDVPDAVPVALCLVCVAVAVVVGALVRRASSASQDPLTGLANRRGFDDAVDRLLPLCARTGTPLSAALLDIDHFKAINDTHGHAVGDDLLRLVADRWSPALPAGAVLARHGGDEFSLLLPDSAGPVALAVVEQLRNAVPEVGLSCGVTQLQPGETASQLMRRADRALYQAKAAGRARSVLDDSGPDPLATELAAALAGDPVAAGLQVHYQGIVTLADGAVVGVEALARWSHPTLGPLSPARFIPLAEQTGLIGALGAHVLRTACADLADLHARTGRRLLLTVNVSGHQLCDPDFPDLVGAALAGTGWPAGSTVIEVTENLFEAESPAAVAALDTLREQGLSVAIDDFGTGYSSLARLDTLPADFLKLDHSFVSALTTSSKRARLMRSIMALSDALGLQLIAEGVETPAQADLLRSLGCLYAQGYHFSRPVPIAEVEALLPASAQTSTVPPLRQ